MVKYILDASCDFDSNDINSIKEKGTVYTPSFICKEIIHELKPKITNTICEPSVGKGVFVFNLLEYFRENGISVGKLVYFIENNLYCYDINQLSLNTFKSLLSDYFKYLGYHGDLSFKNILCEDFLFSYKKFDIIIGNPPYVRIQNLSPKYIIELKDKYTTIKSGCIDLCFAFVEKTINTSDKSGLIIPNNFIKNKSGQSLRKLLSTNTKKIVDFKNKKVWSNISTYTCLVYTDTNNKNDNFIYKNNDSEINIQKNTDIWFQHKSNNKLNSIISNLSYGLNTSANNIYSFDYCDELYVYKKDGTKIEKGVCKKTYKASKKTFYWYIYPYDNDGNIINENDLKVTYPLCYQYLNNNKEKLLLRDSGNIEKQKLYGAWYGYGRKQGLIKPHKENEVNIIIPVSFLKGKFHYHIEDNILTLNGITITINKDKASEFISIMESPELQDYLENINKVLHDKNPDNIWLTLSSKSILCY